MAEEQTEFELVSPERLLVSKPVDMVVVPGAEGDFGVLPRHAPMISTVRPGVIRIYEGKQVVERVFVAGGFAEVTPERCTVLAEMAVPVEEIDAGRLDEEEEEARLDERDAKTEIELEAARRRMEVVRAKRVALRG